MEKTLSLGAFEELSENEVMVTEGGVTKDTKCPVINFFKGTANYVIVGINAVTDALTPAGLPNKNHIWTMF